MSRRDVKSAIDHLIAVGKLDPKDAKEMSAGLLAHLDAEQDELKKARVDKLVANLLNMFATLDREDEEEAIQAMQEIAARRTPPPG